MSTYDFFFSPQLAQQHLSDIAKNEYDLVIELIENINKNAARLLKTVIESNHAEGPIPNSRHFTNYASLHRHADGSVDELLLTYSKRYEAPTAIHDLFESLVAHLKQTVDQNTLHPSLRKIDVVYEPYSIKIRLHFKA